MDQLKPPPLLRASSLSAGYGHHAVVQNFEAVVRPAEIVGMLGPNGAGKTTLLRTLAGLQPALSGSVEFRGGRVTTRRPELNARRGLVLVPDTRELISRLTTRENLTLARRSRGPSIDDMLDLFPGLRIRIDLKAGSLSGGEQQMLAMARALIQEPAVALIDEMTVGLAPMICRELAVLVEQSARELGMGVLLVEQHADLLLSIADRVLVLVHGEVRLEEPASVIRNDRSLLERAYLTGAA